MWYRIRQFIFLFSACCFTLPVISCQLMSYNVSLWGEPRLAGSDGAVILDGTSTLISYRLTVLEKETRAPIAGARVSLASRKIGGPASHIELEAETNHKGIVIFRNIPPGRYWIQVTAYKKYGESHVDLKHSESGVMVLRETSTVE